jgi:hypothetical protein
MVKGSQWVVICRQNVVAPKEICRLIIVVYHPVIHFAWYAVAKGGAVRRYLKSEQLYRDRISCAWPAKY